MPQQGNTKRASSKAGKVVRNRKPRSKVVRKPGREGKKIDSFLASSIYSVKLKGKSGTYVFCNRSNTPIDIDLVGELSDVIWSIYVNMMETMKKETLTFKPRAEGLMPATVLTMALRGLRSLIPKDFEFNVEETNGVFYLVVYKECFWKIMWHCLEVGPVLLKLAKKNKPLHDLFISFLRTFSQKTGVGFWDCGELGYSIESLDEWIQEDDEVAKAEAMECLYQYNTGYIQKYLKRIKRAKILTPEVLSTKARRYKAGNPIANLVYQGAQLLMKGQSIHQFTYVPSGDMNSCFLDFDLQLNIAWDLNDKVTAHCETLLDGMAQEGVQEPVAALNIYSNTKEFDFDGLRDSSCWPGELSNFFSRAWELTENYKK